MRGSCGNSKSKTKSEINMNEAIRTLHNCLRFLFFTVNTICYIIWSKYISFCHNKISQKHSLAITASFKMASFKVRNITMRSFHEIEKPFWMISGNECCWTISDTNQLIVQILQKYNFK